MVLILSRYEYAFFYFDKNYLENHLVLLVTNMSLLLPFQQEGKEGEVLDSV